MRVGFPRGITGRLGDWISLRLVAESAKYNRVPRAPRKEGGDPFPLSIRNPP